MGLAKFFLGCYILLMPFITRAQRVVLWNEDKNYFDIATARQTSVELEAAVFLKNVLDQQSSCKWKILDTRYNSSSAPCFLITQWVDGTAYATRQGYKILVTGQGISITADAQNLIPAVARFLEVFTQCQVYSDTVFAYPFFKTLSISDSYTDTFSPPFEKRILYEQVAFKKPFAQWHGLSNKSVGFVSNEAYGWGLWAHSFFSLVPPEKYFSSHPEYFSLVKGQRKPEQLCLSNKKVLQLVIENLQLRMKRQPEKKYWSVAQIDNENYCECNLCSRAMQEDQAASGPIVRFVNEVAKVFPSKVISTLAYQYSRKPPAVTRPVSNVLIQICALESDRNVPLSLQTAVGSFNYDLVRWMQRTSNIMIWDYSINFQVIAAPFPNLHVFQPNLLYFKKSRIKYVFEQGLAVSGGGLQDYKVYLLAKLLYNPERNVDSLKQLFFKGYYGAAGPHLIQVIDRMEAVARGQSVELLSFDGLAQYASNYLSAYNRRFYDANIQSALQAVTKQPQYYQRVDAFAQAFRFVNLELNTQIIGSTTWANDYSVDQRTNTKAQYSSLLDEYTAKVKKYGPPTFKENELPMSDYLKTLRSKIQNDAEDNLATSGTITFVTPYVPDFKGVGKNTLIDGVLGTNDWSRTWQGWGNTDINAVITFKKPQSLNFFRMRFSLDSVNHLVMPSSILLLSSTDGSNYKQFASIPKPDSLPKSSIVSFEHNFAQPVAIRFLKVIAQWPGYTKTNGVQYGSFMFTDEIYIR